MISNARLALQTLHPSSWPLATASSYTKGTFEMLQDNSISSTSRETGASSLASCHHLVSRSMSASSSQWLWDSTHSLYYNPKTQVWASPQPDGTWKYSDPPSTAPAPRQAMSYSDIDEPTALPEEQVWPDEEEPSLQDLHAKTPLLRLVLARPSSLLPSPQAVALVDPTESVSIGRDKSYTPRIRLKELAVSKSHCTLAWIEEGVREGRSEGYWGVVDNASTHGTFIGRAEQGMDVREQRLSETKTASSAHELKHLE
jgi:hypothetical protein